MSPFETVSARCRRLAALPGLLVAALALFTNPSAANEFAGLGSLSADPFSHEFARGGFLANPRGPAGPLTLPAAPGIDGRPRAVIGFEMMDRQIAGYTVMWQPNLATLGYRHIDDRALGYNEDHYTLGLARRSQGRAAAFDIAWIKNDIAGGTSALSIGSSAFYSVSGVLKVGTRFQHLNRPHFLDGRLERNVAVGLAVTPLDPRFTIATDLEFREDGSDDFYIRYGIETEPSENFFLSASLDNEGGFRLSFALGDEGNLLGFGIADTDGESRRHSYFMGFEEPHRRR